MDQYPLVFSLRLPFLGANFAAGVKLNGAALARQEEDGMWWVDGVHPGALTASGDSLEEAYLQLRKTIGDVLEEVVLESRDVQAFETETKSFFNECDQETLDMFATARERVRNGDLTTKLPKVAHPVIDVHVVELDPGQMLPKYDDYKMAA